ncbi:DUF4190 domain-containing protein [Rathayibacter sp. CAU 1779]
MSDPQYNAPAQQSYPANGYQQPGYVQPVYVVAAPPTNGLAIGAFVSVWFVSLVGIILGHIALSQIKRTGERGHGLALAAVIIGYVSLGLVVLFLLFYVIVLIGILGTVAATAGSYS